MMFRELGKYYFNSTKLVTIFHFSHFWDNTVSYRLGTGGGGSLSAGKAAGA